MITREDLRQLTQVESPEGLAISFYFQPQTPQNKSHKEEAILVKDLVREAIRAAGRTGAHNGTRADLDRILEIAEHLHGNRAKAKAVFACAAHGIWREFDFPARLSKSQIFIDRRFRLVPLARVTASSPRCCVALIDRAKARLFLLHLGEIRELLGLFDSLPRIGRSDGFAGYDAGHLERKYGNEAMRHYKNIAEHLQEAHARQGCGTFIVGCRDEVWGELEPHLHSYVKQKLLGRFNVDPAVATAEQVQQQAQRILAEREESRRQALIREVVGGAQRNGRGSIGLRHVLNSLERGEVQTILLGENFFAPATQCPNCGHLDTRLVKNCAACGHATVELEDVTEALLQRVIAGGVELVYVGQSPEFEKAGSIGALLRFRADQNTPEKLAS